jgi:hypothetical protein
VNKKDRKEFGRYFRACADEMGLRDWRFEVEWADTLAKPKYAEDAEGQLGAQMNCVPGRRIGETIFTFEMRDYPRDDLRQTVCHELLHCHFAAMWHQARQDLLDRLGQDTYDVFIASFERNMEYAIDAAATAWAEHLPLIEWPK